jgi:hypothetical protein
MRVKVAHVSNSPKRVRSVGPEIVVVPRVPTTCAETIRGETPRRVTFTVLSVPLT